MSTQSLTQPTLMPSSIPGEFYLGDRPGTLQYEMDEDTIINAVREHNPNTDTWSQKYIHQFDYEDLDPDNDKINNLRRIMSANGKYKNEKWEIIFMREYKSKNGDDKTIWLKGAMKNIKTGKIALMTSTNREDLLNRPIKTHTPGWFVGHYRMAANMSFWEELVCHM
jgi:hypothetical protein